MYIAVQTAGYASIDFCTNIYLTLFGSMLLLEVKIFNKTAINNIQFRSVVAERLAFIRGRGVQF